MCVRLYLELLVNVYQSVIVISWFIVSLFLQQLLNIFLAHLHKLTTSGDAFNSSPNFFLFSKKDANVSENKQFEEYADLIILHTFLITNPEMLFYNIIYKLCNVAVAIKLINL